MSKKLIEWQVSMTEKIQNGYRMNKAQAIKYFSTDRGPYDSTRHAAQAKRQIPGCMTDATFAAVIAHYQEKQQ